MYRDGEAHARALGGADAARDGFALLCLWVVLPVVFFLVDVGASICDGDGAYFAGGATSERTPLRSE